MRNLKRSTEDLKENSSPSETQEKLQESSIGDFKAPKKPQETFKRVQKTSVILRFCLDKYLQRLIYILYFTGENYQKVGVAFGVYRMQETYAMSHQAYQAF